MSQDAVLTDSSSPPRLFSRRRKSRNQDDLSDSSDCVLRDVPWRDHDRNRAPASRAQLPKVRGWLARAVAINAFQVRAVYLAGFLWNAWMMGHRPWTADRLGTVAGAVVGYLCLTFVFYWWHLWRHRSGLLPGNQSYSAIAIVQVLFGSSVSSISWSRNWRMTSRFVVV
jgi:hypothetical protein